MSPEQELVSGNNTYGAVMLSIMAKVLGLEPLPGPDREGWDPETIRMELEGHLRTKLSERSFNRLMAAVQIVSTDTFYKSLPDFVSITNALVGGIPPGIVALPDAFDVTWSITEAVLIWPPDDRDENPFAPQIVAYIGKALQREGIINPPDVLRLGLNESASALVSEIQTQFSEDPAMFDAIYDMEKNKTQEIEEDLMDHLRQLSHQLARIADHSTQETLKGLVSALQREEQESDQLKPYEPSK